MAGKSYPDRYLLFIEYFNKKKYMSAQTTLDEEWIKADGEEKEFFGGLIQVAVALYHLTNENARGAKKVYERARGMLEPYGDLRNGISLKKLIGDLDKLFAEIDVDEDSPDYIKLCPLIDFQEVSNA